MSGFWTCHECGAEMYGFENFERMNAMLDNVGKSRWFELFGTPERAARTLSPDEMSCWWCLLHDHCEDECLIDERGRLLEWLRSESDE